MATTSTIAIEKEDGTIESITCNNDGYLNCVGFVLHQFYNTEEKVKELIALGKLSSLKKNIKPIQTNKSFLTNKKHSFYHPQELTTIALHRDSRHQ